MSQRKKDFITKEELKVGRTPKELIEWVDHKIKEIAQQEGGKRAIRMRKGHCKQLMEEIYPLSIFGKFQFGDRNDVTLQPIIGNQNYDVLITDHAFSPPRESKLEITLAGEEHLKREVLQECGYAPITGVVEKTGTNHKSTKPKYSSCLGTGGLEDYLNGQKCLIDSALERKLKNKYDCNTSLLIMFYDFGTSFDKTDIRELLCQFVKDELGPKATPFSAIYLVSSSKGIFLRWQAASKD